MSAISIHTCSCPVSLDAIVCGRCGGILPVPAGVFSKIDLSLQQWFYELEAESRLNPTLSTYMAIDRQVRQGAPVTAAVQLATKQMTQQFEGMEERVGKSLCEKLDSLHGVNQGTIKQIGETLNTGLQGIVGQIVALAAQGKS